MSGHVAELQRAEFGLMGTVWYMKPGLGKSHIPVLEPNIHAFYPHDCLHFGFTCC